MRLPLKYVLAVLAFLLTFGSIYAFHTWHQQRLVKEPVAEALQQIEGVSTVKLSCPERKETEVQVTLQHVDNLPQTYRDVEEVLSKSFGQDSYKLTLIDNRNPDLESIYSKIHFALLEGERLGNYRAMSAEIYEQLARENSLKNYELWVDQKRIYLSLTTSRNDLYEVITVTQEGG